MTKQKPGFERRITFGFTLAVVAAILISLVSFLALRSALQSKDEVVYGVGENRFLAERLHLILEKKVSHSRAFVITGNPLYEEEVEKSRKQFQDQVGRLRQTLPQPNGQGLLDQIENAESEHQKAFEGLVSSRSRLAATPGSLQGVFERTLKPRRDRLDQAIRALTAYNDALYESAKRQAEQASSASLRWVTAGGVLASLLGIALSFLVFRAVRKMRESEEEIGLAYRRSRRLMDSNIIGVLTLDRDGSVLSTNSAFACMVGFTHDELISIPRVWAEQLTPPESGKQDREVAERVLKSGVSGPFERELIRKDGSRLAVLAGMAATEPPSDGLVCFVVDISGRKKAESELREALKARDNFLSIASHELKTPLTSLKLQTQMMRKRILQSSGQEPEACIPHEQIYRVLEVTDRQTDRLARLVEDMLDISRIRAGKLSIEPESVDLCALTREVLERMRPQFEVTGSTFELQPSGPVTGEWDRHRIEQVVLNLLTNSVRYGRGKPVTIQVSSDAGVARLSIRDRGLGIAKEDQSRIFERFERAVSVNEVSGLGLGLFIVKQIVLAHSGRIWVESEPGQGSTFHVELPKARAVAA